MARAIEFLPELEGQELSYIDNILNPMDEDRARIFCTSYRIQRKSPNDILVFAVVGLIIIPGLQRFIVNQILMGLLFLFTAGLCWIGSIIDLVNYRELAFEYNRKVADQISGNLRQY